MKKKLNFVIKESITEALLLLMRKKNYEEISITEITKLAGVSRISFYRNYDSKEDILVKYMFERSMNEFERLRAESVEEKLVAMFKVISHISDIIDLLYSQQLSHLFLHYLKVVTGAKNEHSNTEAYIKSMTTGICFGALDEWIRRGRQESAEEMVIILQSVMRRFLGDNEN